MKSKLEIWLLALALTPGLASAGSSSPLRDLAAATGLSERQVQMVVGARTAYAEYRTSYNWAERRFIKTLGQQRYAELMAAREIVPDNGIRVAFNDR